MSGASLELCRELYQLTKWKYTIDDDPYSCLLVEWRQWSKPNGKIEQVSKANRTVSVITEFIAPVYSCDYLLEKLPVRTANIEDTALLGRSTNNDGWSVVYQDIVCIAKTPADALCKLHIQLFKRGMVI